jgi:hypothetical protein
VICASCNQVFSLLTVFEQLSALCCLRDTSDLEWSANFYVVKKTDVALSLTRTADSQIAFDVAKKTNDVAPSLSQEQNFAKWASSWPSFSPQRQFTH